MASERTIIMYHGGCPDGFGGAYAAWKKFGDSAEYIPLYREEPHSTEFEGAHLYFIDFTYPQEVMDAYVQQAAHVTVLDHHEGIKEVVESMPEHVYSEEKSGATLAWEYFHPETATPKLLQYIQDDDTYQFKLPDTRAVLCYVTAQPQTFEAWDEMMQQLEGDSTRETILNKARIYAEYFEILADIAVDKAKIVEFEGYQCYFANVFPLKPLRSRVGNLLAKKMPPIGLVVSAHPNGYGVSIRGDGTVDVAAIAQKYGGNGHTSSAGFAIPHDGPLPWKLVENDETSGD
jgi:uncharacterized protein